MRWCVLRDGWAGRANLVRLWLRAGLVLLGAAAAFLALDSVASADVVDPATAYQPASTRLVSEEGQSDGRHSLVPAQPLEQAFYPADAQGGEAAATPAPEQAVTQAPRQQQSRHTASEHARSPLQRTVERAQDGIETISAFLGRVTSAAQSSGGPGAGGPVLILAVLSAVAALDRRRVLRTRWVTDEEAPELLYAREVICPG